MQFARRHLIVSGAGVLAAGTLAAAALWRKPAPVILTPAAAEAPTLHPLAATAPETPHAPAQASFQDVDGKPHTLADFAGKALVVNLWATWCVPCVAEMPALQAMAKAVADAGITVLPLSSDHGGAEVVRKFYAGHGIESLGIWLDPKGDAARAWGARGLPTTLIIDRQGREVARTEGAIDWDSEDSLKALHRLVG